jgi:hypothetical protein
MYFRKMENCTIRHPQKAVDGWSGEMSVNRTDLDHRAEMAGYGRMLD